MKSIARVFRKYFIWYLFVSPPILLMAVFVFYPLIASMRLSLFLSNGVIENWVGLDNYRRILSSSEFYNAVYNTFYMGVFVVGLLIVIGVVAATLVDKCRFLTNLYRTIYFLPLVTSWVAAAILWSFVFHPKFGLLNYFLSPFGVKSLGLMQNTLTSKIGVIIVAIWKNLGFFMIIFLAGLQDIPAEQYESAKLDGANAFQSWFRITLPSLRHVFIFLIINNTIGALKRFAEVFVLGGPLGSPARSIQTIVLYIYEKGFSTFQFGDAAAASLILFFLILGITMVNFRVFLGGKSD